MTDEFKIAPYRVLARKYRPNTFEEVIGQKALVRTLTNAISSGRIAHAFLLTGVRGIGKTTTARLIARALNCVGPEGTGGPTITPCGVCDQCRAIAEDRHVDVLEMDAASRTGVDDIREMMEGVRYHPVSGRNKIYIIDEVHMLSKSAFNALLKTLEEPPEHVHFVLATTEIRKVPVTVLSRCQRFDLRRVPSEDLILHFKEISKKESVEIDQEALMLISRAADGSVRDGLSIFDHAITLGNGKVTVDLVRNMLGLVDRTQILDLFDKIIEGRITDALDLFARMYRDGADPITVIQDMLGVTHWLMRLNVSPEIIDTQAAREEEQIRGLTMAKSLQIAVMSRVWQMLLKGLDEVQSAPSPLQAGEMLIVRLAYVADLPTPAELIRDSIAVTPPKIDKKENDLSVTSEVQRVGTQPATDSDQLVRGASPLEDVVTNTDNEPDPAEQETVASKSVEVVAVVRSFEEVVSLFSVKREMLLHTQLRNNTHLVKFEYGHLEVRPDKHVEPDLASRVSALLSKWTGTRWIVVISSEMGEPTLAEQEKEAERERLDIASRHPLVTAVVEAFPGAKISRITKPSVESSKTSIDGLSQKISANKKEDDL